MVQLPIRGTQPTESRYASLGLRDMPFPSDPVVDPYSHDPRRNGTIYAVSPVKDEIEKFERLLIDPDDFANRATLAYLWSKGDQQSGRGVGKTALLQYFRQRINIDWGKTEFSGRQSAVVVYVSFPSQVDRRWMEQLALSALVDVCQSRVLHDSRALLRLESLSSDQVDAVLSFGGGDPDPSQLLNDSALAAAGVEPSEIDSSIADRLVTEGVERPAAVALSRGVFDEYLRSFRRDRQLKPLYVPRDTRILDFSRRLLFDDIVNYLRTAGFAGGYLFIDDIENLVDQMPRRGRIEFAKEFGLCTVRPGYANTAYRFFSCVLTTHQQASVGLAQAWGDAGLAAIAPLNPTSPNSVELPLPNRNQAKDIVVAHLDYYRIAANAAGAIAPFTEEGIEALMRNQENPHPRAMLTDAYRAVTRAAQEDLAQIDGDCVRTAISDVAAIALPDLSEGIEDAL